MRAVIMLVAVLVAASLTGCSKRQASEDARRAQSERAPELSAQSPNEPQVWSDPAKVSVVVVAPPSAPQVVIREQAKLAAQQEKVSVRMHGLMTNYAANLANPEAKAKYRKELQHELEIYKQQSLELYRLSQQQAEAAAKQDGAADTGSR